MGEELKLRKATSFAHGHTACKNRAGIWAQDCLFPKDTLFCHHPLALKNCYRPLCCPKEAQEWLAVFSLCLGPARWVPANCILDCLVFDSPPWMGHFSWAATTNLEFESSLWKVSSWPTSIWNYSPSCMYGHFLWCFCSPTPNLTWDIYVCETALFSTWIHFPCSSFLSSKVSWPHHLQQPPCDSAQSPTAKLFCVSEGRTSVPELLLRVNTSTCLYASSNAQSGCWANSELPSPWPSICSWVLRYVLSNMYSVTYTYQKEGKLLTTWASVI